MHFENYISHLILVMRRVRYIFQNIFHLYFMREMHKICSICINNFDSLYLFKQIAKWTPRQRCWKTRRLCRRSRRIPRTRRIPDPARPIPRNRRSLSRPLIKRSVTMESRLDQRPGIHPGSRASGYDRPTS